MVVLGLLRFLGAGRDDTFITLWAGEQLAAGRGLVDWHGDSLEISSSMLHVLMVSLLAKLGPTYLANKVLGLTAGLATLVVLFVYRRLVFPDERTRTVAFAATTAAVATTPSLLYWCLGGLETPYVALLVTWVGCALLAVRERPEARRVAVLVAVQALVLLVRPEGFFVLGVPALALVLACREGGVLRALGICLAFPAGLFVVLCLWRWTAFDAFFPNPVYAKMGGGAPPLGRGAAYVAGALLSSGLVAGAALVSGVAFVRAASRLSSREATTTDHVCFLLALPALGILGVAVCGGGGWMEYHRFVQPALPLVFALAFGVACPLVASRGPLVRGVSTAFLVVLLVQNQWQADAVRSRSGPGWLTMSSSARRAGSSAELRNAVYARDAEDLFPFLETELEGLVARHGTLVIATPQMGQLPYWVRHRFPDLDVRFVDTRGVCDRELARLDVTKGPFGITAGAELTSIVAGEQGELSRAVLSRSPNVLYRVRFRPEDQERLAGLGYRLVHEGPGATVFVRDE